MMNKPEIKKVAIRDVKFGINVVIVEPVNLYECEIGDNCFIGPFVEIQKNTTVGKNCRIQSHAFICELVSIGNDCFISHGVKFINNVSIGTNATILPVKITDDVVIGAGSVVTKDILHPGIYAGNPARKLREIE
jgi:acetyltransferase-like isoleucine patch superfamily enzyme